MSANTSRIATDINALFVRVRRIELILAFIAGAIAIGGGSVGLKVFGVL